MVPGASVAILARRQSELDAAKAAIEAAGNGSGSVAAIACDVTQPDQIESAHEQAVDAIGPIDILVNNAGKSEAHPVHERDGRDLAGRFRFEVVCCHSLDAIDLSRHV